MLQVRRLEKIIENRCVLSIEQLDIEAGEVVAVIGPGGSGKTLLIRLLCGEIAPSSGSISLDGQDIHLSAMRARLGILFEDDMLYERQTVQNNLELYCQLHRLPKSRISEVLEQVGMSDQLQKRISKLAPGTQRRLAFARSLLNHPALLLLDNPGLRTDADTQTVMARVLSEIAATGTAVLLTMEDLSWAGKCSTRIVELEAGRIIARKVPARMSNTAPNEAPSEPIAPERLTPFKITARKEDRILLYDPADLLYATSRDGKTYLRTATEEASTNLTLQELEQRLVGRGFFKAHRAYLVNLQHIKAVIQYTRNSYTLLLNDEKETMVPLSKQCEKELQELLGY